MSLVKWNNRRLFPLNSMFDNFFNDGESLLKVASQGTTVPAVNVAETDDNFELEVAAPGKSKEDFNIEVDNNVLSISSESEEEKETKEKNYTRQEYSYSSFNRSFMLPENTQEEDIQAAYRDGVLKITIPKKETTSLVTKSIPVE